MSSLNLTEANSSGTPGVKPTDRDDLAYKVDEPPNTKLHDYSDPNAVFASILSDPNGQARCEKRQQSQPQCDAWQTTVETNCIFA